MDLKRVDLLKEQYDKKYSDCLEKIQHWEKFKSDYEAVKQRLETLPQRLSYDVTVPFGPHAFTMGKLVHTNEIQVLLGDNWFVEVTADQAVEIAERRIKKLCSMQADLVKEKTLLKDWLGLIDEVADKKDLVEIVEKYDDDEEKVWREQHNKNVKAYHQKLAEERKISEKDSEDEKYQKILENLQLEEESNVTTVDDTSEQYPVDESTQSDEQNSSSSNLRRSISESETCEEDNLKDGEKEPRKTNEKHIRWQDLCRKNNTKITFKHSKPKNKASPPLKIQNSNAGAHQPLIQSPSDIYKHFGNIFQANQPKSILKSPPVDAPKPSFPEKEPSPDYASHKKVNGENIAPAFTGEICEHKSPTKPVIVESSTRPVSRFKSSRKTPRK